MTPDVPAPPKKKRNTVSYKTLWRDVDRENRLLWRFCLWGMVGTFALGFLVGWLVGR